MIQFHRILLYHFFASNSKNEIINTSYLISFIFRVKASMRVQGSVYMMIFGAIIAARY